MTGNGLNAVRRVAFIGGGQMAAALIGGLVRGGFDALQIAVADPAAATRESLARATGVQVHAENAAALHGADVVVLAVKPQAMRAVASALAEPLAASRPTVVSVAAGIPHGAYLRWMGAHASVVRTMPNRPALNACGATALYAPAGLEPTRRAQAEAIMAAVGVTVWVDTEAHIDTVTALSGSGPAYFFLLMEALEQAAIARGLPAEVAAVLTRATGYGAAVMARQSSDALATLREQVTSKGGTTAAALEVFEARELRAIVAAAVSAADERAAALAAEFGAP